ncbi:MAG: PP2C family serine/threonine-protein phosphatase [Lachnospiraceae bacterium]|nr:PP2C family serine/threonine-protein phosphatase [Lachnospiraceae bacterium]
MWNVMQCAVQGRSHIKSDTPCQDKTYSAVDNDTQVIALADGAGSAKLSHYGAETVTKFICSELIEKFDAYFSDNDGASVKQQLIEGMLKSLSKTANQLECEIRELASTLLFVAIKNNQFIIAHIGDGVVGYLKNDEMKIASQPENGEFVNTTVFTTSKDAIMTMKLIKGSLGEIQGFVLMSDGAETSLYNKKERKLADVLKKIMQISTVVSADKVQEQIKQSFENVIIKATTDDCSIAMLVKANDTFKGYLQLSNKHKCELLKINSVSSKRKIRRYDDILVYLQNKQSVYQIARKIHLKPKYTKKYIDKLCMLNFIEKNGDYYHTIVIMRTGNEENNE